MLPFVEVNFIVEDILPTLNFNVNLEHLGFSVIVCQDISENVVKADKHTVVSDTTAKDNSTENEKSEVIFAKLLNISKPSFHVDHPAIKPFPPKHPPNQICHLCFAPLTLRINSPPI